MISWTLVFQNPNPSHKYFVSPNTDPHNLFGSLGETKKKQRAAHLTLAKDCFCCALQPILQKIIYIKDPPPSSPLPNPKPNNNSNKTTQKPLPTPPFFQWFSSLINLFFSKRRSRAFIDFFQSLRRTGRNWCSIWSQGQLHRLWSRRPGEVGQWSCLAAGWVLMYRFSVFCLFW